MVCLQEDGWVVCRVFKKKNLFKVGNETGGGGGEESMSSELNNNNSNNASPNFMTTHRDSHHLDYQAAQRHHYAQLTTSSSFDLYKTSELALNYSPHSIPQVPFQPQPPHDLIPTHKPMGSAYHYSTALPSESPLMLRQLMSSSTNPTRDCDTTSDGLRFQPNCEVGDCTPPPSQSMGAPGDHHESALNEWGMLDRLVSVSSSHHHHHLGQPDSSKGTVRFEDASASSSMPHINHHSLRAEMDFWGYSK